ncbi:MAG: DUF1844 domain-containing protein [Syntrophaceae bacterium]|nr:DUF1844 domain-containing protein [Syntrophaceae bacterium]
MADEKKDEGEGKGFVVRDRRFSAAKETEGDSRGKEEKKGEKPAGGEASQAETPLPEITFTSLIFSLSTSALIQLGEIRDPLTQQMNKNLPLAKQTIDLLGILKEKTKGNLTSDEEKALENILYDLRLRYVKATG